ncbi:pentatricopeptide repeat-containing protein 2, mitochondrial-like [Acipenser oxyrinchus oxyrinchus]|uniref:Pentatricopeptide repeat-containing protein 2, mitochondrial n=1 Tax=Acipenser oxyrinchus oxyrinchus TaxID=40147 RepID=A0AAD8GLJ2_ACIOX|nr:pentatricopeptide repeat-containing protein 2, mitochondrial-like [Acipenser oxyrinchus oxyrinchus]
MAVRVTTGYFRILTNTVKNSGVITAYKSSQCWTCRLGAKRHLLSEDVIRLHEFQQRKVAVAHQIYGDKDNYFETLDKRLQRNELVLKDELKLVLHLCQTPEDVEVAKNAIYRYHEENGNVAFGEFKFGPLFMRLCYELGLEETAADLVKDKALKGFFSDSTSFNIVMDMLFIKGSYDSALEVLLDMKTQGVSFNKDTCTLASAICYKLNTAESYRICTLILEETQSKGKHVPRQAFFFAVALALKQEDVERARSLYSQIMNTESKVCLNLKVLLLGLSGALKDLLSFLESAIVADTPTFVKKPAFSQEVLETVREKMEDSTQLHSRFEDIFAKLRLSGQVTDVTLDRMLCHTPNAKKKHAALLDQRRISRRTFRPLQSALLIE